MYTFTQITFHCCNCNTMLIIFYLCQCVLSQGPEMASADRKELRVAAAEQRKRNICPVNTPLLNQTPSIMYIQIINSQLKPQTRKLWPVFVYKHYLHSAAIHLWYASYSGRNVRDIRRLGMVSSPCFWKPAWAEHATYFRRPVCVIWLAAAAWQHRFLPHLRSIDQSILTIV